MCAASTLSLISTDPSLIESVEGALGSIPDLRLQVLAGVAEACARLELDRAALVVVHLPEGCDAAPVTRLLRALTAGRRPVPLLVVADRHRPEQALHLLRQGVADYLSRPLDLNRLAYLLDALTVRARYEARQAAPAGPAVETAGKTDDFLYDGSAGMGLLMEQVRRVAPQEATVLLGGETGTGKTRLARLLHELSPRRELPFLVVNCGALSASLIESELFGHVRGAFTGADRDRPGKFAGAGRGTLLLDDVDALPPAVQANLLRVVEERLFEPVGSNQVLPMQARVVVASNRRLEDEVTAGRFRQDLYYRLNVVSFHLPPLRERLEILPALADKFVAEFAARNGRAVQGLRPEALRALQGHDWPGNIRELRNVIERAVALCPGEVIGPDDLPASLRSAGFAAVPAAAAPLAAAEEKGTLVRAKEQAEAVRITAALDRNNNNRLRAAAELGISRMTLYKKLHRYGLMGGLALMPLSAN